MPFSGRSSCIMSVLMGVGKMERLLWISGVLLLIKTSSGFLPDLVTDLPGLDIPLPSRQYSGYLQVSEKHFLHYWLVESERSPATDPLVIWFNGGPGCSSMDAFFTENGPFRIEKGGHKLYLHEYRWNKIANMLYLESPVGVGFSYSTDEKYDTNDDLVAEDNHKAIHAFYKKFPEYRKRPLYVTGESYAGIYIPTLLVRILDDPFIMPNLKAAAIGNGYMNPNLLDSTTFHFWYYHGLIPTRSWKDLTEACCENSSPTNCTFVPFRNEICQSLAVSISVHINSLPINPYNIYSACDTSSYEAAKSARTSTMIALMIEQAARKFDDPVVANKFRALSSDAQQSLPCTGTNDIETYMNMFAVQMKIHVKTDLPEWVLCSPRVSRPDTYTMLYDTMKPQFLEILSKNISLLVFNGDQDTACNFFGDERFVDDLGIKEVTARQPWYYTSARDSSKQIGGFAHQFKGLTYATVKGSGHMVPTDQPVSSYQMFQRFLSGIPL